MTVQRPTLVVFDLDDTLYDYEICNATATRALVAKGASSLKLPPEDVAAALEQARAVVKRRLGPTGGSHSRLLYISEALSALGFGNQPSLALNLESEFWRTYLVAMRPADGARDLLAALRYESVPIAIVSDLTAAIQFRKLVHLGFDDLLDLIVISEEAGGDKETLRPFEVLAERTEDAARSHVWFVGDGAHDGPVPTLTERGLIGSGHFWARHGGAVARGDSTWRSLREIEDALRHVVG
jgi:FMN phosphatase YigB (HAD superfamily)